MIPNITAYAVLIFCICVTIVAIRLWLQSEKILNWYIKKYSAEPRIIHPPARSRFHSFLVSVFITAFLLILLASCSTGSKWCKKSNIESGRSSQHHDSKKMRGAIRTMWAKQYGNMCKVRYQNEKEMFDIIYPNCNCKNIPVGCWVPVDSITKHLDSI
jgi:hypothetical protein